MLKFILKLKINKNTSLFLLISFFCFKLSAQDQIYAQRLAALKSQTELIYNPEVKKHIDSYIQNPEKIKSLISLSKYYFPTLEKNLKAKGLPTDLKYLAVSSAELNPSFSNINGASGIWTMSYTVARMYKLKINTYVDERRDVNKSSVVFAQHFRDLYSIYKQWPLVIGAYGCSPIAINKCIRMAGNSLYFWDLFPYLPANCRDLYPQFVAATYILNYYKEHNIKPNTTDLAVDCDSILVKKWLSLNQIAVTLNVDIELLRRLNPIFKKDVVPYNVEGYYICVPKSKVSLFYLLDDSFYRPAPVPTYDNFLPEETTKTENPVLRPEADNKTSKTIKEEFEENNTGLKRIKKSKVFYTVKKGDALYGIADWFDCELDDIKKWNKIKSNQVKKGQRLTLFVAANKKGYYKKINKMTVKQKNKLRSLD